MKYIHRMWLWLIACLWADITDRILYVVGDRLVTASDLAFEADFSQNDQSPIPPLNDPSYALEQRLIDYAILRARAGDTSTYQPSNADVQQRWVTFQKHWETLDLHHAFLSRWGMDDERLQAFIFSRMVVERYIHRHIGVAIQQNRLSTEEYLLAYQQWLMELRQQVLLRHPALVTP